MNIKRIVELSPFAELLATHETSDPVPFVPARVEVEASLGEGFGVCGVGRRVGPLYGGRGGEGLVLDALCGGKGLKTVV